MQSVTISGAPPVLGTWTTAINLTASNLDGWGAISIVFGAGAAATIWVQRSIDRGVTYNDVLSWTESDEVSLEDRLPGVLYRVGCKNLGWSSGSIVCRIDT